MRPNDPICPGILPPVLRDAAFECAGESGAPIELAVVCALGAVSASLGKGLVVQSGERRTTRGNLYIIAGSPSGVGKSEVYREMLDPLLGFERELSAWWRDKARPKALAGKIVFGQLSASSKAALRKGQLAPVEAGERLLALERAAEQCDVLRLAPRLTVDDATPSSLVSVLGHSGGTLLWASPDARQLLKRMSRVDSAEESLLLKAFSGDPIFVHRMTRDPTEIPSPALSCLMLSQPKAVEAFRRKAIASESGLSGRFLFAKPGGLQEIGRPPAPKDPDTVRERYAKLIGELIETYKFSDAARTVVPSGVAKEMLQDFGERCGALASSANTEGEREIFVRRGEQAWRLALALHAARHGLRSSTTVMDGASANSAISLLERLFPVE